MYSISRGYAIYPFPIIVNMEIADLARQLIGIPTLNLRYRVIGVGIGYLVGADPQIIYPVEKVRNDLQKIVEGPGMILWAMKNAKVMERAHQHGTAYLQWVDEMDEVRRDLASMKDLRAKRRYDLYNHLNQMILPKLKARVAATGLKQIVFPSPRTEVDVVKFAQDTPTAYCLWTLAFNLAIELQHDLVANDFRDLAALSPAIPYCDVVVTEKKWASVSRQSKFDTTFGSKVLPSVKALTKELK